MGYRKVFFINHEYQQYIERHMGKHETSLTSNEKGIKLKLT